LHIGIRTQFFLLFTLVSGVPIVWFGLNEADRQADVAISENEVHGIALAASVSREVESQIRSRVDVVESLARHAGSLEDWDDDALERTVQAHGKDLPGFSFIYVADQEGVSQATFPVTGSDGTAMSGTDYSTRDYFIAARTSGTNAISRVQVGKRTGVPNLQVGVPIFTEQGAFRGIAEGSINLTGLQTVVKAVARDLTDYRIMVIDEFDGVIADSDRSDISLVRSVTGIGLFANTTTPSDVRVLPDAEGVVHWAVAQRLSVMGQGWRVLVTRPYANLMSSADAARWKTGRATTSALFFGLLGALLGAIALAAPLRDMARSARAIREGTESVRHARLKPWHSREMKELNVAFEKMMRRVNRHSAALEETVEQRGRDLLVANTRLEIMAVAVDHAAEAWEIIGPDQRVEYVNHAFVEMTGYTLDHLQASPVVLVPYDDQDRPLVEVLGEESSMDGLTRRGIRKDGTEYIEELSIGVIRDGDVDEVIRYFCVRRDVTKRREKEADLRNLQVSVLQEANDKLASSFQHQADTLSNMSHELRTPLNSILGVAEVLDEGIYGPLTDKQTKAVGAISTAGEHLLGLINQVLDLRKMEQGHALVHPVRCSANDLAEESYKLAVQADRADVLEVKLVLSEDPLFIMGDPLRMRQVLINLLGNAQKFTPDGGQVRLEVRHATEGPAVEFVVSDTGVGISEEDVDKIFLPFHQVDTGVSRKFTGSGLGLALVQRFVREHHGVVTVRSQLGEGTSLVVSIPEASAGRDERILLVAVLENEDEAAPMFEALGAEVKRFPTARQFLSFLGTSTLDLIVVDFLVKDMPFDAFMEGLVERNEGPDVPVVMITRMTDSFLSHSVRIHGYLSRPIQRADVEALMTQLRETRRRPMEDRS
jgi:PAS domain S-box-containing protein